MSESVTAASGPHAFLYNDGVMQDLNSFIARILDGRLRTPRPSTIRARFVVGV